MTKDKQLDADIKDMIERRRHHKRTHQLETDMISLSHRILNRVECDIDYMINSINKRSYPNRQQCGR